MKKSIFAVMLAVSAVAVLAFANFASAQFDPSSMTGPPTDEQIQQMMQQAQSQGQNQGMQGQGQQGLGQGMGQGGQGGQGQQKKGLERLKKGVKGMENAVKQFQKAVDGATKAGYPPAQTILDSLAGVKVAIETIKNATEMDEAVLEALDTWTTFADETLEANMESLAMTANFPRIDKQAVRELANLDKALEKAKKKLEKVDRDLSAQFAEIAAKIVAINAVHDSAIAKLKAGDAAGAFDLLENDFFPNIGDTRQSIGMLEAVKSLAGASKQIAKGIKSAKTIVAKVAKKGIDTAKLTPIITESEAKLVEFNALLKSKDFDPTDAVDMLEVINDLRDQFEETLDEVVGDENVGKLAPVNFFGGTMPTMPSMPKIPEMQQVDVSGFGGVMGF
jgi:hypothetical protein